MTQPISGEAPEGMKDKETVMGELAAMGLLDVFQEEFTKSRETMAIELISDLALTYNVAKKLGLELTIAPAAPVQEQQVAPKKTDEDIKQAIIIVSNVEQRPMAGGKMRHSMEVQMEGVGKRYISSFFNPNVANGQKCSIEYVEKPNPKNPDYPYLNLRSINPMGGAQQILNAPAVNNAQTTQKLVPPTNGAKSDMYELGMAKNNAAVIVSGMVAALMTPVDNNALSMEAAWAKSKEQYVIIAEELFHKGKEMRERLLKE